MEEIMNKLLEFSLVSPISEERQRKKRESERLLEQLLQKKERSLLRLSSPSGGGNRNEDHNHYYYNSSYEQEKSFVEENILFIDLQKETEYLSYFHESSILHDNEDDDDNMENRNRRFREFHKQQREMEEEERRLKEEKSIESKLENFHIDQQSRLDKLKRMEEERNNEHRKHIEIVQSDVQIISNFNKPAEPPLPSFDYLIAKEELTREEEEILEGFQMGDDREEICERFNAPITKHCFRTLNYGCWLNDEIINAYLQMCETRNTREDRPYVFSSFFLTTLAPRTTGYKHSNVERWTARGAGRADLFARRAVIFPVNHSNTHWCLACADILNKTIIYYDSMGGEGKQILETLFQYFKDEHVHKKKTPLPNMEEWKLLSPRKATPQQDNCNDCGVFTCMTANVLMEYFSKDIKQVPPPTVFPFHANQMKRIREQIQLDIFREKIFPAT